VTVNINTIRQTVEKSEGRWFVFKGDAKAKLRYISPEKIRELSKGASVRKFARGQWVEEVDDTKLNDAIVDFGVEDWSGFTDNDASGKEIPYPCTRENKIRLTSVWSEFAGWVLSLITNWEAFSGVSEKASLDNLKRVG
jgi:hypothetical protein